MIININPTPKYLERKTLFQMSYDNRKIFFIKENFFMGTMTYIEHMAHLECLK